jgi:hypothetical protein
MPDEVTSFIHNGSQSGWVCIDEQDGVTSAIFVPYGSSCNEAVSIFRAGAIQRLSFADLIYADLDDRCSDFTDSAAATACMSLSLCWHSFYFDIYERCYANGCLDTSLIGFNPP